MENESWLLGEDYKQPNSTGWIKWHGGDRKSPLPPETKVRYRMRGYEYEADEPYNQIAAKKLRWNHRDDSGDIMFFKIEEPQLNEWCDWNCEWNEGYCPVPGDYVIEIEFRDGGDTHQCKAGSLFWGECNESTIVKYRIVEAP